MSYNITIDNSTQSYKVFITDQKNDNPKNIKHVAVLSSKDNVDTLITTFVATAVFTGKSSKTGTQNTNEYGDGNTILLHLKHDMYVYIGKDIIKFRAFSEIKAFVSSINFPYAIDSKNNTYLFKEGVVLMNLLSKDYANPYDYYEDYRIIIGDNKSKKPKHQISMSLDDTEEPQKVSEIYVGDEQRCLKYEPKTFELFNDMTDHGKKTMYIIFANKPTRMVSIDDEDLKKLMISFGSIAQFRPLRKSTII